ncbi:MAG: glycosyltransferase family 39 protein [Microgenomates group bacterium]
MPTKLTKILLAAILIFAIIIRGYKIDVLPSLNPDEAALGYNAYSLLQTGKDEHGTQWPIHFKSFGDYKPGGYVYLALPVIKVLGLTPLAVRLPNLIFSILTIYILYKLVLLLTFDFQLSTLTAFVLAVNPWHIHFSRGAWESSTALFFIILGIYLFYSYIINRKSYIFLLSCLSFVASLYIYHSARLVTPLIVLFLLFSNLKFIVNNLKLILLPTLIAILFTIPVFISFINNGGTARLGGVGLTADRGPLSRSEELLNQHPQFNYFDRIVHNKRILYLLSWAQKYTSHYDANFLFINGDDVPRSRSPEMGQLYLLELPLFILGVIYLLKFSSSNILLPLTTALFLFSPIASSLTFQAPSALRALPLVIPFSITIAAGLLYFAKITQRYFPHNLFLITITYIFSLFYFVDAYFVHAPQRYPFAWNTGFSQEMKFVESQKSKYENIYFTDSYDQPYILYLFYNAYPPLKIQTQISLTSPDKYGFSTVNTIDNIHFGKIDWDTIPSHSLVIAGYEKIPAVPLASVVQAGGTIGFRIYEK